MRSSGAMLLSSAATSSCAIALSSASLASCDEVLEDGRGVLARQHAEDDDLILEAELGQERRDVAGVAVAHHVAQLRVVAGAQHRRQLVGRPRRLADGGERLVALWSVQLLFHLRERCPDDVVMMHVRADGLGRVEPDAMNEIEIAGRERRRMRAEVIGVGAAAAVMDDEPDVERFGLAARSQASPSSRACSSAESVDDSPTYTSDDRRRRIVATMASKTLWAGTMSRRTGRSCRSASADDLREQPPLGRRRRRVAEAVVADVDAEQPDGHDDDVAIARRLERGGHVRERMRVADGHQHVARTSVHLVERELGGGQDVERVRLFSDRQAAALSRPTPVNSRTRLPISANVAIAGASRAMIIATAPAPTSSVEPGARTESRERRGAG